MNVFWIYSNLTGKKTWSTSSSCLSGWSGSYYSRCLHTEGDLPFTDIKFLKLVTLFDLALICVSKCVVEENICMYIYIHTHAQRERDRDYLSNMDQTFPPPHIVWVPSFIHESTSCCPNMCTACKQIRAFFLVLQQTNRGRPPAIGLWGIWMWQMIGQVCDIDGLASWWLVN